MNLGRSSKRGVRVALEQEPPLMGTDQNRDGVEEPVWVVSSNGTETTVKGYRPD